MSLLPIARNTNIIIHELENEVLLYDLSANKALCLNETTALIYHSCDGNKSITEISNVLSKKLQTPVSEDFVWLALFELGKNNLLENKDIVSNNFEGLSRREVIKKIGLNSMISLPLIASIVAPTSISAGSCALVQPGQQFATTLRPALCSDGICPGVCNSMASSCCSNAIGSVTCTDFGDVPPTIQCDCTCA